MSGQQGRLAARMRSGRYAQIERQLDVIAAAVDELREILARLAASEEGAQPD